MEEVKIVQSRGQVRSNQRNWIKSGRKFYLILLMVVWLWLPKSYCNSSTSKNFTRFLRGYLVRHAR